MPNISSLEAASLNVCRLTVKKLDENQQETEASFTLVMDGNALAKAFEQCGIDFSQWKNWANLSPVNKYILFCSAFDRFHPEVTLRDVRSWLDGNASSELWVLLFEASFPGLLKRIEEVNAEMAAKGELKPNLQPAPVQS